MFGLGMESGPILRLAQPTPSHPQLFEVGYLDGELSHTWLEGEGGCVVWQRAEQRGKGTELEAAADSL